MAMMRKAEPTNRRHNMGILENVGKFSLTSEELSDIADNIGNMAFGGEEDVNMEDVEED